jgi:aminoglycoside phosphotransferase (APT) family kinase protein
VVEATQLGGGTFNLVYRIELSNGSMVVLRAAPPISVVPYWDNVALMRREHSVQPYFATLGHLLPALLYVDFTQQIIDRDYMFQEYRAGQQWGEIEDELEEGDELALWRQCGAVVRRLHDTTGEAFGWPWPGQRYATWAELVLARLQKILADFEQYHLKSESLLQVVAYLQAYPALLAAVQRPCLLHGDLWRFNLLVDRQVTPPQIVGVLDADRAWWGDPLADWIIFLLAVRTELPEWQAPIAAFCESYGALVTDSTARQRLTVYKAMHLGTIAAWCHTQGYTEASEGALTDLDIATTELLNSEQEIAPLLGWLYKPPAHE